MKQPLQIDGQKTSSYFSTNQASFNGSSKPVNDPSRKLCFPNSKNGLWNTMPCGDVITFGIEQYHPVTLLCLERCLRLAHRHASQSGNENEENKTQFSGFLMGSTAYTEDERGIILNLDRFDPGTIRSDGNKTPSTPLPGDIVVPVIFGSGFPLTTDTLSTFSVRDYHNAFKLLHHQVSTPLSMENTSLLPIRLQCFYSKDRSQYDDIEMQLHWVSPCVSNYMNAIPIKPVPIIPTALAKNLSGPLNLSSIQNSSKTGYISMNQSRKLLLLLDSDPKSRSIPTVGIWVSGVISVHSPVVWLACMRYLHCKDIYERVMSENQFLLILYSVTSQTPLFFQVQSDDNETLNFDLLFTQQTLQISKQPYNGDSENIIEFRFQSTSSDLPEGAFKERALFSEALQSMESLSASQLKNHNKENEFEEDEEQHVRGRQPKKGSSIPQSILRKNSGSRKSSGSRNRNTTSGVSFSLGVEDSEYITDTMPMPRPSPHPSTIHQSPSLVKPSVPELSIIFDENYQVPNQGMENGRQPSRSPTKKRAMSEKVQGNSPGIRSPLKNINNLNSNNRGISPQDRRPGPMKPLGSHYHHPVPGTTIQNAPGQYFMQNGSLPQRRSRSASDSIRGLINNRNMTQPHVPVGQMPRPIMSYQHMYNSTPMQGQNYQSNAPPIPQPHHAYPTPVTHPQRFMFSNPMPQHTLMPHPYSQNQSTIQYVPNPMSQPIYSNQRQEMSTNPTFYTNHAPQPTPGPITPYTQPVNLLATPCLLTDSHSLNPHAQQDQKVSLSQQFQSQNPKAQTQQIEEGQHVIPQSQQKEDCQHQASNKLPTESPGWMKQLPPEAYQLLMDQDAQLKQLQAQIQKLLAMQEGGNTKEEKTVTTETSTSTDLEEHSTTNNVMISMGVNTGESLYIPNQESSETTTSDYSDVELTSNHTTPVSKLASQDESSIGETKILTINEEDFKEKRDNIATLNKMNVLRCESQFADKYAASEFASIHLDENNLREIASANNEEDSDIRSLASSLRAVDLPLLETSTEQSSFNTPTSKIAGGIWSAQDSPVLGESASMCVIVPPINLNKSLEEVENEEEEDRGEVKDELFMKNLLSQVRDMLKKADIDNTSEISSENSAASIPQRSVKKEKNRKMYHAREDRVARATRKQLRKMGVQFDDDTVNALSSAVLAKDKKTGLRDDFTYTLPEPLIPRLNYLSIMAGTSASNSIYPGPSSTELSMHANAIALKYLSNDQLEEIAALSKVGKNSSNNLFSPLKSKWSRSTDSIEKNSIHDIFGENVKKMGEKNLPGMSLVSPCNMSLATRKYMEKYGLIEGEDESEEEEEEEILEQNTQVSERERPFTPVIQKSDPPSVGASPVLKGIRHGAQMQENRHQQPLKKTESYPEFPQAEPGFRELKMNLGDTLDMILPFLDDLGRHRQQTPSSGTNGRDSRSGTRSSNTGSSRDRMTSVSERQLNSKSNSPARDCNAAERIISPHHQYSRPNSRMSDSGKFRPSVGDMMKCGRPHVEQNNDVLQVLSPKLLQAVAESKKLTQTPGGSTLHPPHSHRSSNMRDEKIEEEDVLAGTWPRHHFRSRSESEFLHPAERRESRDQQDTRRLSSSPRIPGERINPHHQEHRRQRTSPPSSAKLKRIRAIHDQQHTNYLEDVKEVEWNTDQERETRREMSEEEEEPVLTSRVTDAFREKEETNKIRSEEKSEKTSTPHFLQHLQSNNTQTTENFLDLEKIRNLAKLS